MHIAVCTFAHTCGFAYTSGDIVAIGDGQVGGNVQKFDLQVGQTVVYSKFGIGSTDLDIQGQRHTMLREDDCIGIMPKSNATASDIPELRPVGDRVLIKASSGHCQDCQLLPWGCSVGTRQSCFACSRITTSSHGA